MIGKIENKKVKRENAFARSRVRIRRLKQELELAYQKITQLENLLKERA